MPQGVTPGRPLAVRPKRGDARSPAARAQSPDAGQRDDAAMRSVVQSLAKGFRILEAFDGVREEMTLSELAQAAELDPGTTFRMLNTLVGLGYVARVPDSKRFSLTLKILDLGFHAIAHKDLRAIARPVLRALVDDVSEAASFAVLEGSDVLYVERVRAGIARLGVDIRIGTTLPAVQSVIGQTILAFLPPEQAERIARPPSRRSIPTLDVLTFDTVAPLLTRIRHDGFAACPSTLTDGLRILAVPVLDRDHLPVGALSIAAPGARIASDALAERALAPLRAAAATIARALEAGGSIAFGP